MLVALSVKRFVVHFALDDISLLGSGLMVYWLWLAS